MSRPRPLVPCLLLLVLLLACGEDDGTAPVEPAVTSIEVTPSATAVDRLGGTLVYSAVVLDQNGNVMDVGVTWSSGNEAVATVNSAGHALVVGNGTVEIRASAGGRAGSAVLIVSQVVDDVIVSPANATLDAAGRTQAFTASAVDANGHAVPGITFVWLSSDHDVSTIGPDGTATAVDDGSATISAVGGGVPGTATLTVNRAITSVVVSVGATLDALGATRTLTAEARDAEGAAIPDVTFLWTSSNDSVATVSQAGVVTAVRNGSATITASVGGVGGSADVAVAQAVSLGHSSFSVSRTTVPADGTTPVEVDISLRDRNGHAIVGETTQIGVGGTGNIIVQPGPTDVAGSTTGSFASNTAETKVVAVVVDPAGSATSLAQVHQVRFGPSRMAFTSQPSSVPVLRAQLSVQVSFFDAAGNLVTDATEPVTLTAEDGAELHDGPTVAFPVSGRATFIGLSIDVAGDNLNLIATAGDLQARSNAFRSLNSFYTLQPTVLATVSACDDCSQGIALTSPFQFYGVVEDSLYVVSNGYAGLAPSTAFGNLPIPPENIPNGLLALFWDDLNPGATGDVYLGMDSARTTIEYRGIPFFGAAGTGSAVTVSMILFTADYTESRLTIQANDIMFVYHTLTSPIESERATGGSASIGFEDSTGANALSVSFNTPGAVANGKHMLFRFDGTNYQRIR